MEKLLNTDLSTFWEAFRQIKECQDECSEDIMHHFSEFFMDPDSFEMFAYEDMSSLPACYDYDYLYYEDETIPEEDRESYGEVWTFSTNEMVEYYELLERLLKTKVIQKVQYDLKLDEMENHIKKCIVETQNYYDYGLYCEMNYRSEENERVCIKVYLDYNCCFSHFSLYCGVIALFDRYKVKLRELKELYDNEERVLEAA